MLTYLSYFLVLVRGVQLSQNEKRILLNDPGLIEQRLNHLERENALLKDRINQYETAKSGKISYVSDIGWFSMISEIRLCRFYSMFSAIR